MVKRSRISISAFVVMSLILTAIIMDAATFLWQLSRASQDLTDLQKGRIELMMKNVEPVLALEPEVAVKAIESQIALEWFDFYKLRKNGVDFAMTSNMYNFKFDGLADTLDLQEFTEGDTKYILSRRQFGEWDLVIGMYNKGLSTKGTDLPVVAAVVLINLLGFAAVGWYVVRDLRIQSRVMASRDRSGLNNYVPLTREGEVFQKLFALAESKTEKRILDAIPRADQVALKLSEQVPRTFKGALIRIDMNDFGKNTVKLGYEVMAGLMDNVFLKSATSPSATMLSRHAMWEMSEFISSWVKTKTRPYAWL